MNLTVPLKGCKNIMLPKPMSRFKPEPIIIKYKGVEYEKGNEYHSLIELLKDGKLKHIVKRRKNNTYYKFYIA